MEARHVPKKITKEFPVEHHPKPLVVSVVVFQNGQGMINGDG